MSNIADLLAQLVKWEALLHEDRDKIEKRCFMKIETK